MTYSSVSTAWGAAEPHKVLRNTYGLLALSMIPTMAGTWVGLSTSLGATLFGGWMGAILSMLGMFALIFGIERNKNSGVGIALLGVLTFLMGIMLSGTVAHTLRFQNGSEILMLAFGMTASVLAGMAFLSTVIKRSLNGLGSALFIGLIILLVASLANMFIQSSALSLTLAAIGAGIFSLYILVDLKNVRDGYETNYISATLGLYLSIFNLFTSLLRLLTAFSGED